MSFEGTGNVLKIQNLLHICSEHFEEKEKEAKESDSRDLRSSKDAKDSKEKTKEAKVEKEEPHSKLDGSHQGVAVLGIALIAMGEEIGAQMALRTFRHLVRTVSITFCLIFYSLMSSMFILKRGVRFTLCLGL